MIGDVMSFLDDISRIEQAKQALYSVLRNYGTTIAAEDFIDLYAPEFERLLSSGDTPIANAAVYYKCTAVDTTGNTWSGYKATWDGSKFVFETSETTGLPYDVVTPMVGNIYNETATVMVSSLYTGEDVDFVVYVDQAESAQTQAEQSQELAASNATEVSDTLNEIRNYSNALGEIIG